MAGRPGSSRLQGLVTLSGMVAFLGAATIAPRISITRTDDSTFIKYDHLKSKTKTSSPAPADPGLIITPSPKPRSASTHASGRKPFGPNDWIFDTGATTHVCANRALLHSYDTLNPYSNSVNPRAVGYFGPNPVPIVGAGDCTFILPLFPGDAAATPRNARSSSIMSGLLGVGGASGGRAGNSVAGSSVSGEGLGLGFGEMEGDGAGAGGDANSSKELPLGPYRALTRLTVKNVMHIPDAGVNLISWSQLKRAKGLDLQLVEENDGGLTVREHGKPLMRFEARDGLFFLVQADVSSTTRQEIVGGH
ncbi:hypothetical protein A1O3_00605 [Capronia epimyces CBS 606.96]|uniref:Uncharacterized protein n=1 Tax=Capronia epimyces CBS 606.96 TaxID=1182542 RepID=W9YQW3_9EURO|nr:uncharacterized protein A1O3_00605 [Capronia epimyces CBS 606.96]EXJ92055.1 hypothetical protein A1O3_00605 [Capronia epimyces CBS 606.96]